MIYFDSSRPKFWPTPASFPPPPWPDGWPRKKHFHSYLTVESIHRGRFIIKALDAKGDISNEYDGELIHIRAFSGSSKVRIRPNSANLWYDSVLAPVLSHGDFKGISTSLLFELNPDQSSLTVLFDVYGIKPRHGASILVPRDILA